MTFPLTDNQPHLLLQSHWLLAHNVKRKGKGERLHPCIDARKTKHASIIDIVCMMHQNHPTFYITWLAILKIGATPALINTNLAEDSLLHCIKVADSSMLLFDPVYEKQVATISDKLAQGGVSLWAYGESTENDELPPLAIAPTLTPSVLAQHSDRDTDEALLKGIGNSDPAMLIYTR